MTDTMVRMGELAASRTAGNPLVTLGLGSCIGRALLDRRTGVAGLAHVVLPDSGGHTEVNRFKFADHAVPELIGKVVAEATGGNRGRTVRIDLVVLVREAGGTDTQLHPELRILQEV